MDKRLNIQLWVGVALVVAGLTLLFIGVFMPPKGAIDSSVLVAYGEISTFAGSLIGVDYHYRYKEYETRQRAKKEEE